MTTKTVIEMAAALRAAEVESREYLVKTCGREMWDGLKRHEAIRNAKDSVLRLMAHMPAAERQAPCAPTPNHSPLCVQILKAALDPVIANLEFQWAEEVEIAANPSVQSSVTTAPSGFASVADALAFAINVVKEAVERR